MSWHRSRNRYESFWPEYVPVAQRRAQAQREVEKLRKKGREIQPVTIEGRTIARSFWGKSWCTHLESFGDYSNRLPRGRSYVRNGSVCHLGIAEGKIDAIVSGSKLYRVEVAIKSLAAAKWKALKLSCTGKIGSLIELLQGKISDEIMQAVTDREQGLFPLPGEIDYRCNCPDWAGMCKHISAVMYGVGARLDQQPELLFRLRGVDHETLISDDAIAVISGGDSRRSRRRNLSATDLENVFGVALDEPSASEDANTDATGGRKIKPSSNSRPNRRRGAKKINAASRNRKSTTFKPTSRSVADLRRRLGMSRSAFARAVGVSAVTVANWEKAVGPIKPHVKGRAGLRRLHAEGT